MYFSQTLLRIAAQGFAAGQKTPKLVALDTMNYWIERTPDDLKETLNMWTSS